jgi:hypothetical protein
MWNMSHSIHLECMTLHFILQCNNSNNALIHSVTHLLLSMEDCSSLVKLLFIAKVFGFHIRASGFLANFGYLCKVSGL